MPQGGSGKRETQTRIIAQRRPEGLLGDEKEAAAPASGAKKRSKCDAEGKDDLFHGIARTSNP
jgi:hypothetical protein